MIWLYQDFDVKEELKKNNKDNIKCSRTLFYLHITYPSDTSFWFMSGSQPLLEILELNMYI